MRCKRVVPSKALILVAVVTSSIVPVHTLAAVTVTGDVSPDRATLLAGGTDITIGVVNTGNLSVDAGSQISTERVVLGESIGSVGTATISGYSSQWAVGQSLNIGREGHGVLRIADSAVVNVNWWTETGALPGSSGMIEFDHGTLNTGTLVVNTTEMVGTGSIYTNGVIAEGFDLLFDASHSTDQTISLNRHPGQNITIHLNAHDYIDSLGAGYRGGGSLALRDGVSIISSVGYVGYLKGSVGTVVVSGHGTQWRLSGSLLVGVAGNGELTLRDGAMVQAEDLVLNDLRDYYGNTASINLANGGMLALEGRADASLMDYYGLIYHHLNGWADNLRFWDMQQDDWAGLTQASPGQDYSLQYHDTGDLAGYTVLTVHTVPEPHAFALFTILLTPCVRRLTA